MKRFDLHTTRRWMMADRPSSIVHRLLVLGVLALALLGLSPVRPALAQDGDGDVTVTGGSYTLESGETINGNLVVFAGAVDIEEGATISGDVVILGGSTDMAGEVGGSINLVGGALDLADSAVVNGDINRVGGTYDQAEGATVEGTINEGAWELGPGPVFEPNPPVITVAPAEPGMTILLDMIMRVLGVAAWTLAGGLLAVLLVSFLPNPVDRVRVALVNAPVVSLGVGLLTVVASFIILVVMVVTCVMIPLTPIAALALAAGWLLGLVATGQLVGERIASAFNWHSASPALAAGLGTALVFFLTSILSLVDCLGVFAWPLVSAFGLGAVALTRFGRQPYPGYGPAPTPPATPMPPATLDPQI